MPGVLSKQKFKQFVTSSQLHELLNQKGVLVLGCMGSGKSTSISIQLGATTEMEDGKYIVTSSDCPTPLTSHGMVSQTLQVSVWMSPSTGLCYFDTAGLDENRGPEERYWTRFGTSTTFAILKEISCTLVVVSYVSVFDNRGSGVRKLADHIMEVVGNDDSSEHFYNSMAFVVTGAFKLASKVSRQQVVQDAQAIQKAENRKIMEQLERLYNQFPVSSMPSARTALGVASEEFYGRAIDWGKIPSGNENLAAFQSACAVRKLMQTFIRAEEEGRVLLSYPDRSAACAEQRRAIHRMIQLSQPISKRQLEQIAHAREKHAFEVVSVLAELGTEYLPACMKLASATEKLLEQCKQNEQLMKSIENDWESAKLCLSGRCEEEIRAKAQQLQDGKAEVAKLSSSSTIQTYKKIEVRKTKSGFWSWFVGQQWAEEIVKYQGQDDEWFQEYSVQGSNFEKTEDDISRTHLTLNMASSGGYDLLVDLHLQRQEKHLPATEDRIAMLKAREAELQIELDRMRERELALSSCTSCEQLRQTVLSFTEDLKQSVEDLTTQLQSTPQDEKSAICIMSCLVRLLQTLKDASVLPSDLPTSSLQTIRELLESHDQCCKATYGIKHNPTHRSILGPERFQELADSVSPAVVEREEQNPVGLSLSNSILPRLRSYSKSTLEAFQWLSSHLFPLGCALLMLSMRQNFALSVGAFLIALALSNWLAEVREGVERERKAGRAALQSLNIRIDALLNGAQEDTRSGLGDMKQLVGDMLSRGGPPSQEADRGMLSLVTSAGFKCLKGIIFG